MQKKYLILLLCLCATIISGCAKSPEEDIVVNKNEGKLEQAIKNKSGEEGEPEHPDTCQDEFMIELEKINISVDADVNAAGDSFQVVRVKPHMITVDDVKLWADVLFEGNTPYEPDGMTKPQIEKKILELKDRLKDKETLLAEYGDQESAAAAENELISLIQGYEKMYEKAPEKHEKEACEWKFHTYDYYYELGLPADEDYGGLEQTQQMIIKADELNDHTGVITATNRDEKDYRINGLWFNYEEDLSDRAYSEITEEEAKKMGEELLKNLRLDEWQLETASEREDDVVCSYTLLYTPTYGGAASFSGPLINLKSEDIYAANYYYSSLRVDVENGIIKSVELLSPMDVVRVENQSPSLVKFEEIYDSFKNHMTSGFTRDMLLDPNDPSASEAEIDIRITDINLGMFRIKEKNNQEEFLMVPVWTFGGKVLINGTEWGEQVFATMNALDKSVINVNLGY